MLLTAGVRALRSLRGQGLIEYAFLLVLVAIVVLAALLLLGPAIGNSFSTVNQSVIDI